MIDVLYFSDGQVKQKLFARVQQGQKLTLVTVLPPHRAVKRPEQLTPFKELERDLGRVLDQVLVVDEGKVEGMWRDPVVDLADALHAKDTKAAYAAARGYLFVQGGAPQLVVKKTNAPAADLDRLEKAVEKLTLKRSPRREPTPAKTVDDGSPENHAWAVLGLTPGASLAEAKAAWRALVIQYHPDKVAHLAPEFRALADQKTRELNAAWEQLKQALEKS